MSHRRVVCTGLGIISPLGSTPEAFVDGLYAGRSAIRRWRFVEDDRACAKVGGDLLDYDAEAGLDARPPLGPDEGDPWCRGCGALPTLRDRDPRACSAPARAVQGDRPHRGV